MATAKSRSSRRRPAVLAFVGTSQEVLYSRELGEDALARARALPDSAKLLRLKPKFDQLELLGPDAHVGRRPTEAELYEPDRGGSR